jgi:hypothetical protein
MYRLAAPAFIDCDPIRLMECVSGFGYTSKQVTALMRCRKKSENEAPPGGTFFLDFLVFLNP